MKKDEDGHASQDAVVAKTRVAQSTINSHSRHLGERSVTLSL